MMASTFHQPSLVPIRRAFAVGRAWIPRDRAHETVHDLRYMQGKLNSSPTDNHRYDTEEEFLAIGVTSVCISAGGASQLRADHWRFKPLKPPLNTSNGDAET